MGLFEGINEKKLKKMREAEFIVRSLSIAGQDLSYAFEIIDKKTGVIYIMYRIGPANGITPRLNQDGTVMRIDMAELNNLNT